MKWQQAWHFLMVFWWVGILWRLRLPFLFRRRGGFAFVASWKILTWQKHLFSNFLSNSIRNAYVCLCILYNVQVPLVENTTCEIKTSTKKIAEMVNYMQFPSLSPNAHLVMPKNLYVFNLKTLCTFSKVLNHEIFLKTLKYSQKKLAICDEIT